jgi:hypothetical protein
MAAKNTRSFARDDKNAAASIARRPFDKLR